MDVDGDRHLFGAVREYVCTWLVLLLNVTNRFTLQFKKKTSVLVRQDHPHNCKKSVGAAIREQNSRTTAVRDTR